MDNKQLVVISYHKIELPVDPKDTLAFVPLHFAALDSYISSVLCTEIGEVTQPS